MAPEAQIADWETSTNVGEGAPVTPPKIAEAPAAPEVAETPESIGETPSEPEGPRDHRGRMRAKSQRATPEDVKVIAELTKELRSIEAEMGLKPQPGESPRVRELRSRVEIAKAARDARLGLAKPATTNAPPTLQPIQAPAGTAFTKPEPKLEDFADQADPYGAHQRALARWDREKDAFEVQQSQTTTAAQQAKEAHFKQFNEWIGSVITGYQSRQSAYLEAHPQEKAFFQTEIAKPVAEQTPVTPMMQIAIQLHDRGPEFLLDLLRHPDVADGLALETAALSPFDEQGRLNPFVASLQRRLLARISDVKTGSSPARPVSVAPRPPNPVRTVPQTLGEELPGDDASLEAHEKAFFRSRLRRRA